MINTYIMLLMSVFTWQIPEKTYARKTTKIEIDFVSSYPYKTAHSVASFSHFSDPPSFQKKLQVTNLATFSGVCGDFFGAKRIENTDCAFLPKMARRVNVVLYVGTQRITQNGAGSQHAPSEIKTLMCLCEYSLFLVQGTWRAVLPSRDSHIFTAAEPVERATVNCLLSRQQFI